MQPAAAGCGSRCVCVDVCCVSSLAGHYGKEALRGGQDMHNFISSGFVTLGRGHLKGEQEMTGTGTGNDLMKVMTAVLMLAQNPNPA